jgi:hypothetical protein
MWKPLILATILIHGTSVVATVPRQRYQGTDLDGIFGASNEPDEFDAIRA